MNSKELAEKNQMIKQFGYKFVQTKDGVYLLKNGFRLLGAEKINGMTIEEVIRRITKK